MSHESHQFVSHVRRRSTKSRRESRRHRHRRLMIETLEDRRVLSGVSFPDELVLNEVAVQGLHGNLLDGDGYGTAGCDLGRTNGVGPYDAASGVLTNPWKSATPGPHQSLTFMVDYRNPGSPPQSARLLVDSSDDHDMILTVGTPDDGSYSVTVPGVATGVHDFLFVFVDAEDQQHVLDFDAETDPVSVLYVSPADGGPMVAQDAVVTVGFSVPMNHTTLNPATVQVVGSVSGLHEGEYYLIGSELDIHRFEDFVPGETVTVTVTRDAVAADGRRMAEAFTSTFQVLEGTPQPIHVGGTLETSTTWTTGNVYLLTSSLTIPSNVTLTIDPGVVVKMGTSPDSRVSWNVHGTLDLRGTANNKVVFTSFRNDMYGGDTNADGGASSPGNRDWGSIVYANPNNTLHNAVVSYGGWQHATYDAVSNAMVVLSGSLPGMFTIADCVIEHAWNRAVYRDANTAKLSVRDTVIRDSGRGIEVAGSGDAIIDNNEMVGNTYGMYLSGLAKPTIDSNAFTKNTYPVYQGTSDAIYSGNTFSGNTYRVIPVGGTLVRNVRWKDVQGLGMPYLVTSSVTIPAGVKLTIDPGVVVKFDAVNVFSGHNITHARHNLIIDGKLDLRGTSDQMVVFTSSWDDEYGGDSNGDGATTTPRPGHWGAIRYNNPDNILQHAIIRYGGMGHWRSGAHNTQMVWLSGPQTEVLEIRNCVIEHAYATAILNSASAADVWVHNNVIRDAGQGVAGTNTTVESNSFSSLGTAINTTKTAVIEGNTIVGGVTGVRVPDGTVRNNTISGVSGWGIELTGGGQPTVTDNTITGNNYMIHQGPGEPIYSGNTFTGNTNAVVGVSGVLVRDVVWDDMQGLGMPYLVTGDVTVPPGATLTIDPGMVVKFDAVHVFSGHNITHARHNLIIDGKLDLRGTSDQMVVFTSSWDDEYGGDSNGDEAVTAPRPGHWGAIRYNNPDNILQHAIIRYGGMGHWRSWAHNTQMVWLSGSEAGVLEIRHCVIEHAYDKAILNSANTVDLWVHDNVIRDSGRGIEVTGGGAAAIEGNTIADNGYGVFLSGTVGAAIDSNTFTANTYPIYQATSKPAYSGNTFSGNTWSAIAVGGSLTQDLLWEDVQGLGLPYLLIHDVTVPNGNALTIDPGVVVKFGAGRRMTVDGALLSPAAAGDPVVFTSHRDDAYGGDTNGDGPSSGAPGDWAGIFFRASDKSLNHAVIRYAGVNIAGPTVAVRNVTFDRTPDPAVRVQSGGVGTTIHNVNFLNAVGHGVQNGTADLIAAGNNYWGHPSGPGGAGSGSGAGVSQNVLFSPWSETPIDMTVTGPIITSTPNTAAVKLSDYHYNLHRQATATGSGQLVWSRIRGPEDFFIDAASGEITWFPTEPGQHVVGIAVADDLGLATQIWQIYVAMAGQTPPTIISHQHQLRQQSDGRIEATLISVFSQSVQVRPIDVAVLDSADKTVPISTLSYDIPSQTLTVVVRDLEPDAAYTYQLLDTITDDALTPLDGEFDGYNFPTGDGQPGGGFSVSLSTYLDATLNATLVDGTLVVADSDPSGEANQLTVIRNGADLIISDVNQQFISAPDGGTLSPDRRSLTLPLALITGSLAIDSGSGDDLLTIDFSGGNPVPAGGLTFDGGAGDDELAVTGGAFHTSTFTHGSADDGILDLDPDGSGATRTTIGYASLELITSSIASDAVGLVYAGGTEIITVTDAGGGRTAVGSTLGATTTFINPIDELQIDATGGSNTIHVGSLAGDYASLLIRGDDPTDVVHFNGPVTFAAGRGLTVSDIGTVNLPGGTSEIVTTGTGAVDIAAMRNITLAPGSSITTEDGNLTLSANQQEPSTAGAFVGISLTGATIAAWGAGNVSLAGRGGDSGAENHGVQVLAGSHVTGVTGTITVEGVGGDGTSNNRGVTIRGEDSAIFSGGGDVLVTGQGGGSLAWNQGVYVSGGGEISSGDSGTVTVQGTGGEGTDGNRGVTVTGSDSRITSAGGNVWVTGYGGGNQTWNQGVIVASGGEITSGGSGAVTVQGTGGTGTDHNNGIYVFQTNSRIRSAGGDIEVVGTAGAGSASLGIRVESDGQIVGTVGTPTVRLTADSIDLTSTLSIDAGDNAVVLAPRTAGTAIDLGGDDGHGTLGLTHEELDTVCAGTLIIGNGEGGRLTVTDAITRPASTNIELHSGDAIVFDPGSMDTAGGDLLLVPGAGGVRPITAGTDARVDGGTVSFASGLNIAINGPVVDADYWQLNVDGTVDLDGVELMLEGDYVPTGTEVFVIVTATSLMNQFHGLAHGDELTFNDVPLTIHYTGTAVTLTDQRILPNLQAWIDVAAPLTARTTEVVQVPVRVENTGGGPAEHGWLDRLYWSESAALDGSEQLLWQGTSDPHIPLSPGDGYGYDLPVTVPAVEADGTYYLIWQADADHALAESTKTDNMVVLPVEVGVPPEVVSIAPVGHINWFLDSVVVTFSKAIDPLTFTGNEVSVSGPDGQVPSEAFEITAWSGMQYRVDIPEQTAEGDYLFTIGTGITDLLGNPLLEPYSVVVTIDTTPPTVTHVAPVGSVATVVEHVAVTFSEPIRTASLEVDDLVITGPEGLIPVMDVAPVSGDTYRFSFVPRGIPGFYVVQIGPSIEDLAGNTMAAVHETSFTIELPDLVVSHIDTPIEGFSGRTIQYSWTLTNQGAGPATGTWYDRVLLSTDTVVGNDLHLGEFEFTGTIEPGESITRTHTYTLPMLMEGDRWFIIQTDVYNQVYEHTNEGNNTRVSDEPMTVQLSPFPNLQVTEVIPPGEAFSSQQTVVQWVVSNTGTGSTSAPVWYDGVWLSTDSLLDSDDTYLGQVPNPSYLNPGDSYLNSLTVTLPQGIQGDYWFIVKTDAGNHVYEHNNEHDNVAVGPRTSVTMTPPPDLRVTEITGPDLAFTNQTVTVGWTVLNDGTTPGAGGRTLQTGWFDTVYLSSAPDVLADAVNLGRVWRSGVLNPGESYTQHLAVTIPVHLSGYWYFFVHTDSSDHVFEHIFKNNNLEVRRDSSQAPKATGITMSPPDLQVDYVTAPANARAGHPFSFTYQVTNRGVSTTPNSSWRDAYYLSTDTTLDSGDIPIGSLVHSGALNIAGSPNDSYTRTVTYNLPHGLEGNYYVLVQTDSTNVVFEGPLGSPGETNNVTASAATVEILSNPPDLVIVPDSFEPWTTAQAGSFLRASWGVLNQGTGPTVGGTWRDKVYVSLDNVKGGSDDRLLGTFVRTGNLAAGDSYDVLDRQINVPIGLSGTVYLYVRTDADNQVYEGDNGHNNDSELVPVTIVQSLADLQVTALEPLPGPIKAGDWVNVEWTVENTGSGQTNALSWSDRIYLSPDSILGNGNETHLGSVVRPSPLGAGESYTASATVRIPTSLSGPFYLGVWTDADGKVFESDDTNNTRFRGLGVDPNDPGYPGPIDPDDPGPIEPPPPGTVPVPDLVLVEINAPAEAFSGQPFELTWTVRNDGDPTPHNWYDQVYLSLDQVLDPGSDISLGHVHHNSLGTGESYTKTHSFTIPRGLSGPFYVFVFTDRGNHLKESNEFNNVNYDRTSMLVNLVPPADLVVGTITVPSNASPGMNATITYTVQNQGEDAALGSWYDSLFISADDTWDIDDAFFARVRRVGPLAGGASYTHEVTAPLPGVLPGEYHVILRTDILNQIPESDETNNIGASLDRVDIDAQLLPLDEPQTGTLPQGRAVYYKTEVLEAG